MDLDNDFRADSVIPRSINSPIGSSITHTFSSFGLGSREKTKSWERPGTLQEPSFINKRINLARQPKTIFEIIQDQQQSLTGVNLTTAFVKLVELTQTEESKQSLCGGKVFTEMMLTAAQNARLFTDDDLAKIIWALAQLEAEPSVEVMDDFMCNLYSRMEKVDTQTLSVAFWGLARLDYVPGEKVLIRSCQTLAERLRLREGKLSSFCRFLWSLAVMGYCPFESILVDFVDLSCTCLGSLTPLEVGQLLWSLIQFTFHPGSTFLEVVDTVFCTEACMWTSEEVSLLFWGMASFAYRLNHLFVIRSIDLVQQELSDCTWPVFVRVLNGCARLCFHPGEEFLLKAASFLTSKMSEIYYEAIETILWSYATFSFHPGCDLLDRLSSKIEGQISLFTPLHLANVLWCYALFDACSSELWTVIIDFLQSLEIQEIPPEAFYRIYQIHLLKSQNSGSDEGEVTESFELPLKFQEAGLELWKNEISKDQESMSEFQQDVMRILITILPQHEIYQNYNPYPMEAPFCLSFYIQSLDLGFELIEEFEFTVNTTQPIGSAIMKTKLATLICSQFQSKAKVQFLKYSYWTELATDGEKQQYLNKLLLHHTQ